MAGRGRMRVAPSMLRPHGGASMVVSPPPPPPIIEQKLATQHLEIQRLLTENQRFAATHVALRQETAAAQHELHQLRQIISEKDARISSLMENAVKLETDLEHARSDAQKMNSHRQELLGQVQQMTQDLHRARLDAQQINVVRAENDTLRQELQRARAAYEQELKANNDNKEQRQAQDNNVFPLSSEIEKLRSRTNERSAGYVATYSGTNAPYSSIQQSMLTNGTTVSQVETWTAHLAPSGAIFYYNTVTGVTQWEKPTALVASQPSQSQPPHQSVQSQAVSQQPQQPNQLQMQQAVSLQQTMQQVGQAIMQQQSFQLNGQPGQVQQQSIPPQNIPVHNQLQQGHLAIPQYPQPSHGQLLYAPSVAQVQQNPSSSQVAGGAGSVNSAVRGQAQQPQVSSLSIQNSMPYLPRSSLDSSQHPHVHHGMASAAPQLNQKLEGAASTQSPSAVSSPSVTSRPQGATLLVYGISAEYRDQDLADLFRPYGSVLYAKVASEKEMVAGRPCGTISMDTRRSAEAAIAAINGISISGRGLRVELKREENEVYQQQQQQKHHHHPKQNHAGGAGPARVYHEPLVYRPY